MVAIIGCGRTPFGRLDDSLEALVVQVARGALDDAGVEPAQIDAIWLGHFNAGMVSGGFAASLALGAHPDLRWRPATRTENACASGAAAIGAAVDAIGLNRVRCGLVIGAEKMTHLQIAEVATRLGHAAYQPEEAGTSFPAIFARFARAYAARFSDPLPAMAEIAANNHANALASPLAQVNDILPMSRRDLSVMESPRRAIAAALDDAGCGLDGIDVAEVHDWFTIAEPMIYEAMDLASPGEGACCLVDGTVRRGGALPMNLSGALKAGASGGRHRRVDARAGGAAIVRVGGRHPDHGRAAVAICCSILEAVR